MKPKYFLFSVLFTAIVSQAEARNLLDSFEEFSTLNLKATTPSTPDQEVIDAFNTYRTNNTARATSAVDKLKHVELPLGNFYLNYSTLLSEYRNGKAPTPTMQANLYAVETFLKNRQDVQGRKRIAFDAIAVAIKDIPEDRAAIEAVLPSIFSSLNALDLTKYSYNSSTGTADYTPVYKTQKYTDYFTISQNIAPQSSMDVLSSLQKIALSNSGGRLDLATQELESGDGSVVRYMDTRKIKWRALSGTFINGDSILPNVN